MLLIRAGYCTAGGKYSVQEDGLPAPFVQGAAPKSRVAVVERQPWIDFRLCGVGIKKVALGDLRRERMGYYPESKNRTLPLH